MGCVCFYDHIMLSYFINAAGLGLQSNSGLLPNWLLHNFHDICGPESVHFGDSGCF